MPKLTDTFIRGLKCPTRQEFKDDIVPGLWLRVGAGEKGSKTWVFRFRQDGAQRSVTLGSFPDLGLKDARLAAESVRDGSSDTDKGNASSPSPTFAEVAESFIASKHFQRNRTALERAQTIRTGIVPYVGAIPIKAFGRKDAKALVGRYDDEGKSAQGKRVQALASQVLGYAVEEELIPYNPMSGMKSAPTKARTRFLTLDELRDLWTYVNTDAAKQDPMRRAIRWIIATGQRRNECIYIHTSEVDTRQKQWTLPAERVKNSKEHVLPLTDWHMELLGDAGKNGFYFANKKDKFDTLSPRSLTNHVSDYCDMRGISVPFTPHDFRRTMTTYLASMKFQESHIKRVLNHSQKSVTSAHYDQYAYMDEKRALMEAWRDFIKAL